MSGRRNGGFGDFGLSGLPSHLRPRSPSQRSGYYPTSGGSSSRRDGFPPSGSHPSDMYRTRHDDRSAHSRAPPVSYFNGSRSRDPYSMRGSGPDPDAYYDSANSRRRGAMPGYEEGLAAMGGLDAYGMPRRASEDPRRHPSVFGDMDGLPNYRSASAYAREQMPPAYGSPSGGYGFSERPPPYSSFSGPGGYGRAEPMQYPPTRRPSAYGREHAGGSSSSSSSRRPSRLDPMDPRYYMHKHDRR